MEDTVNDINLNIPARGPKGDPGPKGDQGLPGKDGHSVWKNVTKHGPNGMGCWFTDLANASASNPPKVNDIMINPDGNMAMITKVNITNDPSTGGGMFDYGPWIGNIKGPKGNDGKTPVRGTDYWTDADQQAVKDWLADLIVKKEW